MPQYANKNWYNAHNFYGDLADLDSAKLDDVTSFFKTFYAPNNAVLVVSGDFETASAKKWIDQYFSKIPSSVLPPKPDLTEPQQEKEQRFTKEDKLAKKPAIAVSYKMPERNTTEYYAMGLIDQMLVQGQDSKLYQALVQQKGYTNSVSGGINIGLGSMFDYNGPMLWTTNLIHDANIPADSIIHQFDLAVADLKHVTNDDLQLAVVKLRSGLYDAMGGNFGIGKVNLLACFALFDDNPAKINTLESEFKKITPEIIRQTAAKYLNPKNRTILIIEPKPSI
ncbi:MAG: M16 family metallopeptidase [Flavisolibacter sp.]